MTDAVKSAEKPGGICTCGSKTETPCPRPAVVWWGLSALCEGHHTEAQFQERVDGLTFALGLLEDMLHEANGSGSGVLADSLLRSKSELQSKLSDAEGVLGMASNRADSHKAGSEENK